MENLEANNLLPINKLPDVPLRRIFSFLPILERLEVEEVCKRWRIIGEKGWPDVEKLKITPDYSDDILLLILKRCGLYLKELTFYEIPELLYALSMVIQLCELDQLKSICIHMSLKPQDEDVELVICQLRKMFEKAEKLVDMKYTGDLGLYGTDWFNTSNLTNLHQLYLENHSEELPLINLDQFPNLKELFLHKMKIVGGKLRTEEESVKWLEIIEIYESDIPQDFIQRIGISENLQQLILRSSYSMRNEDILNIALHCQLLNKLIVDCLPNMTSECFKYLGVKPSLEELGLINLENVNSRDIAYLKNVKHLFFDSCTGDFTGDGTIELITESTNLECLWLIHIPVLKMTFLNDVRQLFHRHQRKKPLSLHVFADFWNHEVAPVVSDHPLLELKICSSNVS